MERREAREVSTTGNANCFGIESSEMLTRRQNSMEWYSGRSCDGIESQSDDVTLHC